MGGEIYSSASMVYLDPSFLIEILKPLVEHRVARNKVEVYVERCRASLRNFVAHNNQTEVEVLVDALECLLAEAELREELLGFLWKDVCVKLSAAHRDRILETLCKS